MSEDQLKAAVIELAELLGWRVFSIRRSDMARVQGRTGKGFPDLLMVRRGRALAVELKSAKGRVTAHQLDWLRELAAVEGVVVATWRPADWLNGTCEYVLRHEGL